jgi:hypothetical protein
VVPVPALVPAVERQRAINEWLADAPEVMNRRQVRSWLREVWESERGCPDDLRESSFREQELGRLLVRDDGWLDVGELAYLRHMRRSPARRLSGLTL